jgi:CcmD family protein
MADLTYLYAAYTFIWLGIFAFMLKLYMDTRRLGREIAVLEEVLDGKRQGA